MSDSDRERELLRDLLSESHRATEERTPPFAEVWSRAVAEAGAGPAGRPRRPRIRLAVAAAAAVVVVAASTVAVWIDSRRSRQLDRALTAAAAVGEWRAPLDFLLETPGREWLRAPSSWDPQAAAADWGLTPPAAAETKTVNPDST